MYCNNWGTLVMASMIWKGFNPSHLKISVLNEKLHWKQQGKLKQEFLIFKHISVLCFSYPVTQNVIVIS